MLSKITKNIQYKLASVVLAFVFWYLVQGEEVLEINRKIQVNIKVADGYIVRGSAQRFKDVTLVGPRVLLGDFSTLPLEAEVVVPPKKIGKLKYRIDKEHIKGWNSKIKLTVHDAYLTIYVDMKMSKNVVIKEHFKGIPAEGYILEKASIQPRKVLVSGIRPDVLRLKEVFTEPIDLTGMQKSTRIETGLITPEDSELELAFDKVMVSVQLGEKKVNRKFHDIPLELEGQQYVSKVQPQNATIIIQGTPGVLQFTKRNELRAFVDVRNLGPGQYEKQIQVKIPSDTVLIETIPEYATIDIFNRPMNMDSPSRKRK